MLSGELFVQRFMPHEMPQPQLTQRARSTDEPLFSKDVYQKAEEFDTRAKRDDESSYDTYCNTIVREYPTDQAMRVGALSVSTLSTALSELRHAPGEYKSDLEELARCHAESAKAFAKRSYEEAKALVKVAARFAKPHDRLCAFRQFFPEKEDHVDADRLRALATLLPHLPAEARPHETRKLFARVAQLPADKRARTVKAIADDGLIGEGRVFAPEPRATHSTDTLGGAPRDPSPEPPLTERQIAAFSRESMLPQRVVQAWQKQVDLARAKHDHAARV